MTLQVLVTTMNKTLPEIQALYQKMHLTGDAIFGNQCGKDKIHDLLISGHQVKIVNQSSIGVSRNRNAILKEATADLAVFMDDDVVMSKGYEEIVESEFKKHKDVTSIRFNMLTPNQERPIRQHGNGLSTYRDVISYGVWGLVISRKSLLKNNLLFNEDFGPGARFYCGEDSMFSRELLRHTHHNYVSKIVLGNVNQETSTWYEKHDEKFFVSQGAMYYHLGGPLSRWFFIKVMLLKHRKYINMKWKVVFSYLRKGIREARLLKHK